MAHKLGLVCECGAPRSDGSRRLCAQCYEAWAASRLRRHRGGRTLMACWRGCAAMRLSARDYFCEGFFSSLTWTFRFGSPRAGGSIRWVVALISCRVDPRHASGRLRAGEQSVEAACFSPFRQPCGRRSFPAGGLRCRAWELLAASSITASIRGMERRPSEYLDNGPRTPP